VQVAQVASGLWRWTARHPGWTPEQGGPDGWEPEVACVYCEAADAILLVDPLVPEVSAERERFWRALDRDVSRMAAPHVMLTCAWHARSASDVVERYPGATVWVHADGMGELPSGLGATAFREDDELPGGAESVSGLVGAGEVLLWLPSHRALVAGDTLLGGGPGGIRLCPESWLGDLDPGEARALLRARLDGLPVERILPAHGDPVLTGGREALDRALY
jgi:hypothetical protein